VLTAAAVLLQLDPGGQTTPRRRRVMTEPMHHDDDRWLADLSPLQRFLLFTDGTVTPALSAYIGEPIGVRVLRQERTILARADAALDTAGGRPILERRVLLHGTASGTVVLYADSRVAVERLTVPVRDDLLAGELPIGMVLRRHRVETFRESLGAGRRPATGEAAAHLGRCDVCWRDYAIVAQGRPLMVVHEEFPVRPASRTA
jgi:beta-ribofuranosylaminobenzene 5'-phosphate synthase